MRRTYTIKEYAEKYNLKSEEYVRQCCRGKPGCKLKKNWRAYLNNSRRWVLERSGPQSTFDSPDFDLACKGFIQYWNELSVNHEHDLVWNEKVSRTKAFKFEQAPQFFRQLAYAYQVMRTTRVAAASAALTLKIYTDGRWNMELDSKTTEPFLKELIEHKGEHAMLLKMWRCALGHSDHVDGTFLDPYEAQENYFKQFAQFETCLNCGKNIIPHTRRHVRMYCDPDCGDTFRKWFYHALKMSPKEQLLSVCRKIDNLE